MKYFIGNTNTNERRNQQKDKILEETDSVIEREILGRP